MSQTSSIRVLHITASSMIGGGPEHVWQLVRHLSENIECFIAAPSCAPYGSRFVQAVKQERFLRIPQRKFNARAFFSLVTFIKKNKIDIIHSHGKGAGIYGRLAALITGVKSVHTFHGIHLPQKKAFRTVYIALERLLCGVSKACIAVSDGEHYTAHKLRLCKYGLTTIYNGVFVPLHIEQKSMPVPFAILHVSRFDRAKNSLALFDMAVAMHKNDLLSHCTFVIVGDGEELPVLKQKVHEAGFSESFLFVGTQGSVIPYYEGAACLVSTSLREGMPLAVLEAQAHGVPVIVSDVVGNRDAIAPGETGFLFSLKDASAMVLCVEKLLHNENLWQEMRIQGHTHVQQYFSVQKMAEKTAVIYEGVR